MADLVPPSDIGSAAALHATAWNTTRFLGPALAGLTIATIGLVGTFALSSLTALIVAASFVVLERFRRHRRPRPPVTKSVIGALAEGARFAFAEPGIQWALLFAGVGSTLGTQTFQALAPLYVSESLGLSGGAYGVFIAVWGGGALGGAYVVAFLAKGDRRRWLIAGAAGLGVALGALSFIHVAPLSFVIAGVLGFTQITVLQNALVTVQLAAPDALRGRIMGIYLMSSQGVSPIGAFAAGWVAEGMGVQAAMLLSAVVLGLFVVSAVFAYLREKPVLPA
jgi:predicted MFS family arabinose efflux permease